MVSHCPSSNEVGKSGMPHVSAFQRLYCVSDPFSECIATFQLSKILDAELTEEDEAELAEAETLAKRFLSWDIDEETTDVMDVLRDILEVAGVIQEEPFSSDVGAQEDDEDM